MLLVTSAIHMPRAAAIFRKLNIDIIPAPTDYLVPADNQNHSLEGRILSLLPDANATFNFSKAMKEYVGFVIYRLRGWT